MKKTISQKSKTELYRSNWSEWKKIIMTKKEAQGTKDTQKILRELRGR